MGTTGDGATRNCLDVRGKKWKFFGLVALDICLCLVVTVFTLSFALNKMSSIAPFRRGFFCDDQSLMYPYYPDSVSIYSAAFISMFPIVIIMLLVETARTYEINRCLCPSSASIFVRTCYKTIGSFLFGSVLCLLITEILKLMVGRLRPHFFAVCKPDFQALNCTNQFVVDAHCYGTDSEAIIDARKSFPSGHTTGVVFSMMYLIIYLQIRVRKRWQWTRVICPLFQGVAFCVAAYVSISRLQDYKHHVEDVIGGAFLGVVLSIATVKYINKLSRRGNKSRSKENINCSSKDSYINIEHGHDNMSFLESPRSDTSFKPDIAVNTVMKQNSVESTSKLSQTKF